MLRGRQHQRRHELGDEGRLDVHALVAHHYVHHLRQVGTVHLFTSRATYQRLI